MFAVRCTRFFLQIHAHTQTAHFILMAWFCLQIACIGVWNVSLYANAVHTCVLCLHVFGNNKTKCMNTNNNSHTKSVKIDKTREKCKNQHSTQIINDKSFILYNTTGLFCFSFGFFCFFLRIFFLFFFTFFCFSLRFHLYFSATFLYDLSQADFDRKDTCATFPGNADHNLK